MPEIPVIDEQLCDGCGICIEICPVGALLLQQGKIVFQPRVDCDYCGTCEAACPRGAISCAYEIVIESPPP
jgi:ferredoxin